MAGFLAGLGSFSGGAAQGIQSGAELAQRIQSIKQGQMMLDQQKKQLAADPAVANWLAQAQGGQGAPPMGLPGPGGPMPPQPQGGPPAPPQQPQTPPQAMTPGQPSVPGGSPPQGQAGLTPPGPATAPPLQAGGGASLPAPGQGQGEDPSSPQAAFKVMQTVASQIKAANPNIDPHTLLYATQKVIDMSKGIEPGLRAQASFLANQLRAQVAERGQDVRADTSTQNNIRSTDTSKANTGERVQSQEKIAAGHDATSLQRVAQQGSDAMARTQINVDAANKRATDGTWSREKATAYKERANAAGVKLKAANSRLTALTNAGVKPDDPRVAAASKDIQGAVAELDRVNKAAGLDAGTTPQVQAAEAAPIPGAGGPSPPPTQQHTATDAKGNKVTWNGKAWVPAPAGK
jgi:hypothetical protein